MKKIILPILISLLLGCQKEDISKKQTADEDTNWFDPLEPANIDTIIKYHYDTISYVRIDLEEENLELLSIEVTPSVPDVVWRLFIQMGNSNGNIQFTILDPNNNGDSLIQVGEHHATGNWGDDIFNYIDGNNFQLYKLKSDEIVVYIEKFISNIDGRFAKGYIEIKKELYWEWPACILLGDSYIYPGDDEYLDYCIPFYYIPAKIHFDNLPK
jgi:hypothetical protein